MTLVDLFPLLFFSLRPSRFSVAAADAALAAGSPEALEHMIVEDTLAGVRRRFEAARALRDRDPADVVPEVFAGPAVTQPGDIWQLGRHKLICSDALDPDTYQLQPAYLQKSHYHRIQ